MRIQFQRSGGVGGIVSPAVAIDTATLPQEEAQKWHSLVTAAAFFNLPARTPPDLHRDQFSYRITVDEQGAHHTIQTRKGAISSALDNLIDALEAAALAGRKGKPKMP